MTRSVFPSLFHRVLVLLLMLAATPASFLPSARAAEAPSGADLMTNAYAQHPNDAVSSLRQTDPDLVAMRDRLMSDSGVLSPELRHLVTISVLTALQAADDIETAVDAALEDGVHPVKIREAVYQCAPYAGFPRTEAAVLAMNDVFRRHGVALPLEDQSTVTEESRFRDGLAVQKRIFGDAIDAMHAAAADNQKTIMVTHLSAFCFGDIYTRRGLDLRERELLTFSVISALGGCESQVKSHVQGNVSAGNDKNDLIAALETALPLIGFPRTLNALSCVNAVLPD